MQKGQQDKMVSRNSRPPTAFSVASINQAAEADDVENLLHNIVDGDSLPYNEFGEQDQQSEDEKSIVPQDNEDAGNIEHRVDAGDSLFNNTIDEHGQKSGDEEPIATQDNEDAGNFEYQVDAADSLFNNAIFEQGQKSGDVEPIATQDNEDAENIEHQVDTGDFLVYNGISDQDQQSSNEALINYQDNVEPELFTNELPASETHGTLRDLTSAKFQEEPEGSGQVTNDSEEEEEVPANAKAFVFASRLNLQVQDQQDFHETQHESHQESATEEDEKINHSAAQLHSSPYSAEQLIQPIDHTSSEMEGYEHQGFKKDEEFQMAGRSLRSSMRRKGSGLPKNVTSVPEEAEDDEEEHLGNAEGGLKRRSSQEKNKSGNNEAVKSAGRRGIYSLSYNKSSDRKLRENTNEINAQNEDETFGKMESESEKNKAKRKWSSENITKSPAVPENLASETKAESNSGKDGQDDKEPRQASLLLVGPKSAGKTTLMYNFLDRTETPKPTLAIDYMYGRKQGRISMVKDVCHLWELASGTMDQLLSTVISSCSLNSLAIVVVLDLSRPELAYDELVTIIAKLKSEISDAVKKASVLDPSLASRLQQEAWARVGAEHQDRARIEPFPVPLVVVGGKYDIFQDLEPDSKKVLCRGLRFVCHTNGAALQFFSSRDGGLVKKAKEIMSHYGFGSAEVKSLAQDYNRPLIVPCGSDSLQVIGGGGDNPAGMTTEYWRNAIATKFPKPQDDKGSRARLPDDPSRDSNYREPDVDNLRAQKDQELERLCREAGRLNERYADLEL
ncbi:uncharacterized protein LOC108673763 [Hyalella azteca]|uniref:Cytoplasmic dynein 2 light intermediate chain 1 n=1 Tax=Hyalella azteca TaxID=294128 RepID=A0A8B7NTS8_HYAAZ|nr:uncharacterized protein LOC108673763 [Hyalella azteca]